MEGLALAIDEKSWVARAREGDSTAFEAIYGRYERRIYAFVYRLMGNAEDAYDLTQDTFIKAYQALPRTAPDLNLSAW
ncbi:MAG TPA: sigma factor, partial [Chloroflexia bacterium]|nr:sigma factor [Chloroflexia bacterium]